MNEINNTNGDLFWFLHFVGYVCCDVLEELAAS